ncbi:NTE family protein [Rhodopseudomonas pseudopalustris]|uniref:NTE family protein n=1 Tax=Rhodopseudomonas pseudopalustris TaxID=1513892 RepID=A0A1H8P4E0_9BRAD|nr:NTE family protein [Rhodopseudomonas pseudopalustris]
MTSRRWAAPLRPALELRSDLACAILHDAAQENAVTVVHLIYRKRDDEAASKDYDFSRLNMIEHWKSGEQDVYVSMRHEEWQRGPQDGETMVTWDLTRDAFK